MEIESIKMTDTGIEIIKSDGTRTTYTAEDAIDLSKWIMAHNAQLREIAGRESFGKPSRFLE